MKRHMQDIEIIKQSFEEVIEDVDVFIETLKRKRVKDFDKDLLLFDFIAGMEVLKVGLDKFMKSENDDFDCYRLRRIARNPIHEEMERGIVILEVYEIIHYPFPKEKLGIQEDLHSILNKLEKLK